jgi:hypothetical protein
MATHGKNIHRSTASDPGEKAKAAAAIERAASMKPRPTSGMTTSEAAALKHARKELSAAADVLHGMRMGRQFNDIEIRRLADDAARGLPTKMAGIVRAGVYDIASMMAEGQRDDYSITEWAHKASNAAPQEFIDPNARDVNRPDESVDDLVARIPRA